jgi:hypothetical protein
VPGQNGVIAYERGPGDFGAGPPDIWTSNGRVTSNAGPDRHPSWSPDGARIAFDSAPSDTAPSSIWTMSPTGTGMAQVTTPAAGEADEYPAWSPDGTKILFARRSTVSGGCSALYTVAPDGSNLTALGPGPQCLHEKPAWSPDGNRIAYFAYDDAAGTQGLYVANADNAAPIKIRPEGHSPSWAPGGKWILYHAGDPLVAIVRTTPDGAYGGPVNPAGADYSQGRDPEYSPDGKEIADTNGARNDAWTAFTRSYAAPGGGASDPAWQPLQPPVAPPGYPRPKGATPLDVSLVPAFDSCFSANDTHGAPLAFGSCAPPAQSSSYLTVGTPDANGQLPTSIGRARIDVLPGDPLTTADEADAAFKTSISDVRCRAGGIVGCGGPLQDFTAGLREVFSIQITDKFNGGSSAEAATVQAFPAFRMPFALAVPCTATPDPDKGATCAVATTLDAIDPDIVSEGRRATWELGQIQLWDPGADGNIDSDDNTLFAVQGLFVP